MADFIPDYSFNLIIEAHSKEVILIFVFKFLRFCMKL